MDYIITILLMIIGIGYDASLKISKQKKKFPMLKPGEVVDTFFSEEWNTFFTSALGIALFEILLYTMRVNEVNLPLWFENWGLYILAAVWGYAGQRLAYKFLGSAEAVLEKKADQIKDSNL